MIDRSALLEPKVLIAAAGYRLGGREHDRRHVLDQLRAALPTLQPTIVVGGGSAPNANAFEDLTAPPREPGFVPVPAAHPLWVLFSSGSSRTRAARRTRAATPCGRRQEIPRTLTGKKLEVPVERILAGAAVEAVAAPGAVDKPGALRWSEQLGSQPTGVAR